MKNNRIIIFLGLIYFVLHIFNLTLVPVFADEAIYIRWAQLLLSDPQQYFFFALNDGKTPLYIWLLSPFIAFFDDPLFAGRLLTVIIGLLQMIAVYLLSTRIFNKRVGYLAAVIVLVLPFWVINHRFALMDGLLALFTTITVLATHKLTTIEYKNRLTFSNICSLLSVKKNLLTVFSLGFFFFLALLTKLPAVLLIPAISVILLLGKNTKQTILQKYFLLGLALFISLILFSFLAATPIFPQLFARGSDFLINRTDIIERGWSVYLIGNARFIVTTFMHYFSLPLFIILWITPLLQRNKSNSIFFLAGLFYLIPILCLAKVLHSRYLLPSLPFLTISLAISLDYCLRKIKYVISQAKIKQYIVGIFSISIFLLPLIFTLRYITNPESVRLTDDDQAQYFVDWSAGHGVKEVTQLLLTESTSSSIALATEGSFGTLPDGILMYLFNKDVNSIYVEGIGQPIYEISGKYKDRALDYEKQWLVVNNYRLRKELPKEMLLAEYCHPQRMEYCLQLWDISSEFTE